MKRITFFMLFSLVASLSWSQAVIDETFSDGALPTGWTNNDLEGNGQVWQFDNPGNRTANGAITEPFAVIDSDSYGYGGVQNAALETPAFDASSIPSLQLEFDYYFKNQTATNGQMFVEVFNGSAWVEIYHTDTSSADPEHFEMDITAALDGAANAQVRFRYTADWAYFWMLDNVLIGPPPTCIKPSNLLVDATTQTTANLSWTAGANETQWELIYGTPGFDPETAGTTETVTGTPNIALTSLNPASTYEFYVKALCGATDGDSVFSDAMIFTTACDAMTDFVENFDTTDTGEVPNCFSVLKTNAPSEYGNLQVTSITNATSAPNVFEFNNAGDANAELYLVSPELSNLADADHRLRFQFDGSDTGNVTLEVGTMSDATDVATFTSVETLPNNPSFEEYLVNFNQSSTDSYVAFKVSYSSTYYSVFLDDVHWEAIPNCPKPQNLILNAADQTTADLSWTEGANETEWEVVYGAPDFDPTTEGNTEAVTGSSNTNLTGLSSNTEYEVYVRAICGSENSEFANPISFFTSCAATTVPFTQDFNSVITPALPNCAIVENNGNGNSWQTIGSPNNYGFTSQALVYNYNYNNPADTWYFTQGIELEAGTTYQIGYTYGTNSTSYTEKLKLSYGTSTTSAEMTTELDNHPNVTGPATTNTLSFDVDADGIYYFGFQAYSNANQNRLYLDDIQIDVAPSCLAVSGLVFQNIDSSSAEVSWTENGTATEWELLYGVAGFDPTMEGESVAVSVNPETTLTDLDSEEDYDVYVRAICSTTDESALTGPASFTTTVSCPAPMNLGGQSTGFDSASLLWLEDGNATEWVVIYGEPGFDPATEGTTLTDDDQTPGLDLTGLTMDTRYEFYVKAICGADDESALTGPVSFSTYYCQPMITSTVEPITLVEVAGISNASATSTGGVSVEDFTDVIAQMEQGESYPIALEGNTNGSSYINHFVVYIDWNQNGILDDNGEMYEIGFITGSTGSDGQQATGTIEVPSDAMLGDTRMRVIKNFNTSPVDPCENHGFGQIEDYSVQVSGGATCEAPTDTVVDNITETTANVSWTTNGTETEWEILYGAADFNPETEGTSVMSTDVQGETLTGLTADTTYDVYVRAICEDDFMSDWTASVEFTTEELGVASELFASFTYYPNPVRSELTLKSTTQIEQVNLYNLLGQQVINTKPSSLEVQLNMDSLPSGVYLMKVNIQGSQKTFRLIKE